MENNQIIRYGRYGWVDFKNLPIKKNGTINWKSSAGKTIDFQYDNIVSTILINRYCDNNHICISIDGYVDNYIIRICSIKNVQLSDVLHVKKTKGNRKNNNQYNVGDIVNNALLITSIDSCGTDKYHYQCIHDGYCGHISYSEINKGRGCPICANKIVVTGINDIATTNPSVALLFEDEKDTKKYTQFSNKYVYFKCPTCGAKLYKKIRDVSTYGLVCNICSDGISYPNKVIFNMLSQVCTVHKNNQQLQFFEPEKTFSWAINVDDNDDGLCGSKRYDFYIPFDDPIIIEAHGRQHIENVWVSLNKMKHVRDEIKNDIIKHDLAIKNGIKENHYIVLDCQKSDINFIKESILSSALPALLNFSADDIDWLQCDKFATSSRVFEACAIWNSGIHKVKDIANNMKVSVTTIYKYIHKGIELGLIVN